MMARFKTLIEGIPAQFKRAAAGEQEKLLDFLENWQHNLRRRFPRKPCSLPVDFAIEGRAFVSMLGNISAGGAFIDTPNGVAVGQKTTLVFSLPTLSRPNKIKRDCLERFMGFWCQVRHKPYSESGLEETIERF